MATNINFNDLWRNQDVPRANKEDLLKRVNRLKKSRRREVILLNLALLIVGVFMIWIWYFFQPAMLSTKIGIMLTLLSFVVFLLPFNRLFTLYKDEPDGSRSGKSYLASLSVILQKELILQSVTLRVYLILLGTGMGLYLFEYSSLMPLMWQVFTYVLFGGWLLFNWFYIQPKQTTKKRKALEELIEMVKSLE